jgi:hypothetical protein
MLSSRPRLEPDTLRPHISVVLFIRRSRTIVETRRR